MCYDDDGYHRFFCEDLQFYTMGHDDGRIVLWSKLGFSIIFFPRHSLIKNKLTVNNEKNNSNNVNINKNK